jgi:hypothetical protein
LGGCDARLADSGSSPGQPCGEDDVGRSELDSGSPGPKLLPSMTGRKGRPFFPVPPVPFRSRAPEFIARALHLASLSARFPRLSSLYLPWLFRVESSEFLVFLLFPNCTPLSGFLFFVFRLQRSFSPRLTFASPRFSTSSLYCTSAHPTFITIPLLFSPPTVLKLQIGALKTALLQCRIPSRRLQTIVFIFVFLM